MSTAIDEMPTDEAFVAEPGIFPGSALVRMEERTLNLYAGLIQGGARQATFDDPLLWPEQMRAALPTVMVWVTRKLWKWEYSAFKLDNDGKPSTLVVHGTCKKRDDAVELAFLGARAVTIEALTTIGVMSGRWSEDTIRYAAAISGRIG